MAFIRKRLKPRFSLLAMLIVVTFVSLWLGRATYLANRHEKAVQTITANEGRVTISNEDAPDWLPKVIRVEYFQKAYTVDMGTRNGRLTGTKNPKVNDEILAQLEYLPNTKTLNLSHNETVTDAKLSYLRPLKNLRTLHLYRTQVQGPGLANLVDLPLLKNLYCSQMPLRNEGLKHLSKLKSLKFLDLSNTKITDAGIAYLAELDNLESLQLKHTDITDKSLLHLAQLRSLKGVNLRGTAVTADGVTKFLEASPNCQASYSFSLDKVADDRPLFPSGTQPSPAEINAMFKARGIEGYVRVELTEYGNQITGLSLNRITLSEQVVLDLIKTMPHLRQINCSNSLMGDRFLEELQELENLEYLDLRDSKVTDAGLKNLAECNNLRELILSMNALTNEGLQGFPTHLGLEMIIIEETRVTKEAAEKLEQRMPGTRVICH